MKLYFSTRDEKFDTLFYLVSKKKIEWLIHSILWSVEEWISLDSYSSRVNSLLIHEK